MLVGDGYTPKVSLEGCYTLWKSTIRQTCKCRVKTDSFVSICTKTGGHKIEGKDEGESEVVGEIQVKR